MKAPPTLTSHLQIFVHLVVEQIAVVLLASPDDTIELPLRDHRSGRVVREVHHHHLRRRSDELLEVRDGEVVELGVVRAEGEGIVAGAVRDAGQPGLDFTALGLGELVQRLRRVRERG